MGGSMHVESAPGLGSKFCFSLPLGVDPSPGPTLVSPSHLAGQRTLIVDGNEVNRHAVHKQVSSWGMCDTSVGSGALALEEIRAAQRTPDPYRFVIADFQLPDMDGAAFAASVKSDPATHGTIIVMLASIGSWREARRLEGSHVDACLVKPIRQTKLYEALSAAWSNRNLASLAAHVKPLAGHDPDRCTDQVPARVLVADHNAVNRKVAVRMLESLGFTADVSASGSEAVEMMRQRPYDLVLMDCQMPSMNGLEAAGEIRKNEPPDRRTPIVAMTAETGAECLDECLANGVDDILLKPIRMETLTATMLRWLPAGREKQVEVGDAFGG
jgi:CheY-like chemotaxis protein